MSTNPGLSVVALRVSPCLGFGPCAPETEGAMWSITSINGNGALSTVIYRGPDAEQAGIALAAEYKARVSDARPCPLNYVDPFTSAHSPDLPAFGDRMAEVLWDRLEALHELPDAPEEYAEFAEGHPLDLFRAAFLQAATLN